MIFHLNAQQPQQCFCCACWEVSVKTMLHFYCFITHTVHTDRYTFRMWPSYLNDKDDALPIFCAIFSSFRDSRCAVFEKLRPSAHKVSHHCEGTGLSVWLCLHVKHMPKSTDPLQDQNHSLQPQMAWICPGVQDCLDSFALNQGIQLNLTQGDQKQQQNRKSC